MKIVKLGDICNFIEFNDDMIYDHYGYDNYYIIYPNDGLSDSKHTTWNAGSQTLLCTKSGHVYMHLDQVWAYKGVYKIEIKNDKVNEIDKRYLYNYLNDRYDELHNFLNSGKSMNEYTIMLPDIETQLDLVNQLTLIDKEVSKTNNEIKDIKKQLEKQTTESKTKIDDCINTMNNLNVKRKTVFSTQNFLNKLDDCDNKRTKKQKLNN